MRDTKTEDGRSNGMSDENLSGIFIFKQGAYTKKERRRRNNEDKKDYYSHPLKP